MNSAIEALIEVIAYLDSCVKYIPKKDIETQDEFCRGYLSAMKTAKSQILEKYEKHRKGTDYWWYYFKTEKPEKNGDYIVIAAGCPTSYPASWDETIGWYSNQYNCDNITHWQEYPALPKL